ncbi:MULTISPECIES: lysophospholipid acyltransferase family protein [Staphylococcus]|uniref:1-acyl-sn-glycerol-3-phosphate acyltransferase n=1 Tax=Staphylococcus nepalensis TaxID=214473 RepID=A0A291JJA1_9STAP|nr:MULTISPECIES: 1-acyl-sn-glycerol-3-phosphate acyltransferase [Staphylococcus]ATH59832.1 acyl-phosphate glycerol 3-phosphate acyltransferase [Staphylococcus nepalensis]ATH64925.1 acyl-phosphate glycerol 3-phosphate acyltransferase [Staphylococcus nepalensis]AWI44293.1 acyl-phosphate glycerol 3-phosphate acyltransferase [Staphylococcus nepalensis]MBO1213227.1 1-acyl-sn-glycerol-3-phosphate acyltransferase [Staphylococcus nepalensis]MBO1215551.1 1-acyl-sn-glycerol-3-phosphate acyltransferase [
MYRFVSGLLNFILRKICKSLEVQGKEHIPQLHRYVVTCTHESYNEVIMLGMAIYPNQIHYMAKKELFYNKWFGRFLSSLNAFPVDRDNPGPSTLKKPIKLLKENKTVGIFPTGHRMKYDEGAPMKRGAVTIALMAQAPILPAAYVGPKEIKGLVTGKSIIRFGEPIETKNLPKDMKRNEKLEYLTKELEKRTIQLQDDLNEYVTHNK